MNVKFSFCMKLGLKEFKDILQKNKIFSILQKCLICNDILSFERGSLNRFRTLKAIFLFINVKLNEVK